MTSQQMIPAGILQSPDVLAATSHDAQLLLLWLILCADDAGQEVAYAGVLGRAMDDPPEKVEAALQELVAHDFLILSQVGKRRYYQVTRWRDWQVLRGQRLSSPSSASSSIETDASCSTTLRPEWA